MERMGIAAIYRQRNTSAPHPAHPIYPYLLKNVTIGRKLAFVLGAAALGMTALAGLGLWGLRANAARTEDATEHRRVQLDGRPLHRDFSEREPAMAPGGAWSSGDMPSGSASGS